MRPSISVYNRVPLGKAKEKNRSLFAGFSFPVKKPAVSDSGLGVMERFVAGAVCQAASFGRICRL